MFNADAHVIITDRIGENASSPLTASVNMTSLPLTVSVSNTSLSIRYHQLPLSCSRYGISDVHFFSFFLFEQLEDGKTPVEEIKCKKGCAIIRTCSVCKTSLHSKNRLSVCLSEKSLLFNAQSTITVIAGRIYLFMELP